MYPDQFAHNTEKVKHDYVDKLLPGYRWCPTDKELIVSYLRPKIESRELPQARIHDKNIYNYDPEELSATHLSVENKWYFMTPRERMCPKGTRPKRTTKKHGFWKTTQRHTEVYDERKQLVGYRRNLVYHDETKGKTAWLMHEYTTVDPNLPVGNGRKLNNFVLCTIYKKETRQYMNNNLEEQDRKMGNEDEGNKEQNQSNEEPSPRRQRLSLSSILTNESQHIQVQQKNHHLSTNFQMVAPLQSIDSEGRLATLMGPDQPFAAQMISVNPGIGNNHDTITSQTRMDTSLYPITDHSNPEQLLCVTPHSVAEREITQSFCGSSTRENQHNQPTVNGIEFPNGDSSSTLMDSLLADAAQLPAYTIYTSDSSVTSRDLPPSSTADQSPQTHDYDTTIPMTDEEFFNFPMDSISFDEFDELMWGGVQPIEAD